MVLAVPVAPPGWTARFQDDADELVCLETPESFFAIGQWYADLSQTADEVEAGLGTLLFDLLTLEEEYDRANVFDIELLAHRLVDVTGWLRAQPDVRRLRVGYFGASTGAGAALWAATDADVDVAAVVSRDGRPDLAGPRLPAVTAPTLLIVGGDDHVVVELNRAAQRRLRCENRLAIVPGATHLFEEPGMLQQTADLARDWFADHLAAAPQPAGR